jgi:predicted DNA-binding transcriptional regulator YafY
MSLPVGPPTVAVVKHQEYKRLVADRFRRIWHIVEDIAAYPGSSRRELADKFHLSERQVQADLNVIRADMRLPLVRRQGYRFTAEALDAAGALTPDLREAQLLVLLLRRARTDRAIPTDRLDALMSKLPLMFPPHLQPLVQQTLDAVRSPRSQAERQVFAALADGILHGTDVRLHYAADDVSTSLREPVIRPELLLPYLDSWYVIGACRQRQDHSMMFNLDGVAAATLMAPLPVAVARIGRSA